MKTHTHTLVPSSHSHRIPSVWWGWRMRSHTSKKSTELEKPVVGLCRTPEEHYTADPWSPVLSCDLHWPSREAKTEWVGGVGGDGSEVTSGQGCLFGLEKGGGGQSARRAGERRCLWRSAEADRIRWLPSPLPCTGEGSCQTDRCDGVATPAVERPHSEKAEGGKRAA